MIDPGSGLRVRTGIEQKQHRKRVADFNRHVQGRVVIDAALQVRVGSGTEKQPQDSMDILSLARSRRVDGATERCDQRRKPVIGCTLVWVNDAKAQQPANQRKRTQVNGGYQIGGLIGWKGIEIPNQVCILDLLQAPCFGTAFGGTRIV
jgi:hypothetical protein